MLQNLYKFELIDASLFQETKCLITPNLYTIDPLIYKSSINI